MTVLKRLKRLKERGYSIKLIARLSSISEATLYSFSSKRRELSIDKLKRLESTIERLERL